MFRVLLICSDLCCLWLMHLLELPSEVVKLLMKIILRLWMKHDKGPRSISQKTIPYELTLFFSIIVKARCAGLDLSFCKVHALWVHHMTWSWSVRDDTTCHCWHEMMFGAGFPIVRWNLRPSMTFRNDKRFLRFKNSLPAWPTIPPRVVVIPEEWNVYQRCCSIGCIASPLLNHIYKRKLGAANIGSWETKISLMIYSYSMISPQKRHGVS